MHASFFKREAGMKIALRADYSFTFLYNETPI